MNIIIAKIDGEARGFPLDPTLANNFSMSSQN